MITSSNFDSAVSLNETEKQLLLAATHAVNSAYAPYSGFQVGCAIRGIGDNIFTGANCENSSYGASICAERAAALCAVGGGQTTFTAVAVAAGNSPTPPCGICRQFLSEFSKSDTVVIFSNSDGTEFRRVLFGELLPHSFSKENMK